MFFSEYLQTSTWVKVVVIKRGHYEHSVETAVSILANGSNHHHEQYIYFSQSPFNKEDPETKGMVENVVKYVKHNFLKDRTFVNNADLLAIDDIMLLPVSREEATAFFNLINTLHEKTSVIITTNKSPTEWAKDMNDEVLTTALLDRLLYHCEVIKLDRNSYRMENRKTIFKKKKEV